MDAGLVTAMSGALAQTKRIEVIANNLANADTPGFKADELSFEETYIAAHQKDTRSDIPERPYTDRELLSKNGDEPRPVLYGNEFTELRAGSFKQTGNPLDIAIQGNGFLEVLTPNGIRLTRAGNLALDPQGRLVTPNGFLVLGPGDTARAPAPQAATASLNPADLTAANAANQPATAPLANPDAEQAARAISVGSANVHIDAEGNIYNRDGGRTLVGKLGLVQIENPSALKKEGNNLFRASPEAFAKAPAAPAADAGRNPASAGPEAAAAPTPTRPNPLGSTNTVPQVRQGMLEASNVNPVSETSEMIEAHRLFDQNARLLQVQGDLMGRISEVGRF